MLVPQLTRMTIGSMPWDRHHVYFRTVRTIQNSDQVDELDIDFEMMDGLVAGNLAAGQRAGNVDPQDPPNQVPQEDPNAMNDAADAEANVEDQNAMNAAADVEANVEDPSQPDVPNAMDVVANAAADSDQLSPDVRAAFGAASESDTGEDNSDAYSLLMLANRELDAYLDN